MSSRLLFTAESAPGRANGSKFATSNSPESKLIIDHQMESKNPTTTTAVTTIIHFVPNGPIDAAAKKSIRSHVTLDVRRKQRHQKLLSLQAKPSKARSIFFEDNLCRCYVSGSTVHDLPPEKPSKSRSAIQRQQIADSYKICPRCRGTQFGALSGQGQLRHAKTHPAIVALLQTGLDPFNSMPEVPNLSPKGVQLLHDIKTFSKCSHS